MKNTQSIVPQSSYLGSCIEVGENTGSIIDRYFSDASELAQYFDPSIEDNNAGADLSKVKQLSFDEFSKKILIDDNIKSYIDINNCEYYYIEDFNIYIIYDINEDIHYFYGSSVE